MGLPAVTLPRSVVTMTAGVALADDLSEPQLGVLPYITG